MFGSRTSRARKMIIAASAAVLVGGALTAAMGLGEAADSCGPLDTALNNNVAFIAGQRANPDADAEARIANRQAVVDQIQQRRAAAGCTPAAGAGADEGAAADDGATRPDDAQGDDARGDDGDDARGDDESADESADDEDAPPAATPVTNGDMVCIGSTVTVSGEPGAPAAASGTLPVGTTVTVSNLDNGRFITVEVTSTSGSCIQLNRAAFELVGNPGTSEIQRAIIQREGDSAAAVPPADPPAAEAP